MRKTKEVMREWDRSRFEKDDMNVFTYLLACTEVVQLQMMTSFHNNCRQNRSP